MIDSKFFDKLPFFEVVKHPAPEMDWQKYCFRVPGVLGASDSVHSYETKIGAEKAVEAYRLIHKIPDIISKNT